MFLKECHMERQQKKRRNKKNYLLKIVGSAIYGSLCTQLSSAHLFTKRHPSVQQFDCNSHPVLFCDELVGKQRCQCQSALAWFWCLYLFGAWAQNWTWQLWRQSASMAMQFNKACAQAFPLTLDFPFTHPDTVTCVMMFVLSASHWHPDSRGPPVHLGDCQVFLHDGLLQHDVFLLWVDVIQAARKKKCKTQH